MVVADFLFFERAEMRNKLLTYFLAMCIPLVTVASSYAWTINTCTAAATAPYALTWNVTVAANRYWKFEVREYWTNPDNSIGDDYRWSTGGSPHPTNVTHSGTVNRSTVTDLSFGPGNSDCKGHLYDGGPAGPPPTAWTEKKVKSFMW